MKKYTAIILSCLLTLSVTGCDGALRPILKSGNPPVSTAQTVAEEGPDAREGTTAPLDMHQKTVPVTNAIDLPATAVQTTTVLTSAITTTADPLTSPQSLVSQPTPSETSPVETKPAEKTPDPLTGEVKSNLPLELQAELNKSNNGMIIIYHPEQFPEIKAITKWNIVEYNTNTQIFLVLKSTGSRVEISKSQMVEDERVVIPGDVIRDWETTSDFEVIRILYTDPETIPFNFIRVKDASGRVTTTPLHTSMRDNPDWEVFQYDEP